MSISLIGHIASLKLMDKVFYLQSIDLFPSNT